MKNASSLLSTFTSIVIILLISSFVYANDNGGKNKKSEKSTKEQVSKNTMEDIGLQVQLKYSVNVTPGYEESEEDMANWYITQSLPKPEKVSKKQESELEKINRKIIKKERKECKKLQKSIKKGEIQTQL